MARHYIPKSFMDNSPALGVLCQNITRIFLPGATILMTGSFEWTPADAPRLLSWLQQARFLTSAPKLSLCPTDAGFEVAFAGRSNAGKSSAINALTAQRQLARASKTPGRTQMINFFCMQEDDTRRLVDLPGYGYAAVPEAMKLVWQKELERYLTLRQSLRGLVLLMDIRHPLKDFDRQMLLWAQKAHLPVHVLLTKADKLNRNPAQTTLFAVQKQLKALDIAASVQLFSALHKQGLEQLAAQLADWLAHGQADAPSLLGPDPTDAAHTTHVDDAAQPDTPAG